MRKLIALVIISLWASWSLAAPSPAKKLIVILDGFPNPDHAPLLIAEQQGFFKEEGLDVQLIDPMAVSDATTWVTQGKADIGITYEPQFMQQIDQGLPIIRIGTLIDSPLNCLVVLKDSGIKTLADLKGKHIGSIGNNNDLSALMLKTMLAKQGITNKQVEWVNIQEDLTQALLSHKVDAVSGMMRNMDVPQLEENGHRFAAFFPEDYGIPNYSALIFITRTANIQDQRLPHFLAAIRKAVAYLDEHPEQTWQDFIKQYPESNNPINHDAWFASMPYFAEDPSNFDRIEWEHFAQFMQKNQLIKKVQPISRYAIVVS